MLLGHDGPWFGPGDTSIRGRAPFPRNSTPAPTRNSICGSPIVLGFVIRSSMPDHDFHIRPSAPSARPPHRFWARRLDVLDRRPRYRACDHGRFARQAAFHRGRGEADRHASRARRTIIFPRAEFQSAVFIAPNKQSIYGEFLITADAGAPATQLDALHRASLAPRPKQHDHGSAPRHARGKGGACADSAL